MQKCYSSSARCVLGHDLACVRRGITLSSRQFSVSRSSPQDDPKSSKQPEYTQNFPPRSDSTSRPPGPLLKRASSPNTGRAFDLSAPQGQNATPSRPAQSTTLDETPSLRISRFFAPDHGAPVVDARRAAAGPGGQRLVRKPGFPGRTGSPQSMDRQSGSFGGRSRGGGASRGGKREGPPRRRRESDFGGNEEELDAEGLETAMYGAKQEPKSVPYEPKAMTMEELRLDWPATAIDATGLAESVQQRAESLANRIPHGFLTPQELAQRFYKGQMVHFESETERLEVLRIAAELAKSRADILTERKGESVTPEDMAFSEVGIEEKKQLGAKMVKGEYPNLQTQSHPFLNMVVRNLRNNGTYHETETSKFMDKIQGLIAKRGGAAAPQAQKSV